MGAVRGPASCAGGVATFRDISYLKSKCPSWKDPYWQPFGSFFACPSG